MEGRIQAISRHVEGQESGSSNSYEENSKNIWIYEHISMYTGVRLKFVCTCEYGFKSHVQQSIGFFRDDIGTSKYNISTWGLKSPQRDMEGHKYVIYQVW